MEHMTKNTQASLTALRVGLGILFLWSGTQKALSGFTAEQFLEASRGPLAATYAGMAGSPVVDFLVVFGEIGIGVALVLGLLVRFASICGATMMLLFYLAQFPPQRGLVNDQVIYLLSFVLLYTSNAGTIWGLDKYWDTLVATFWPKPVS